MSFDYNNGRNGVWTGSDANRVGYHQRQAEEAAKRRREEDDRRRRESEAARRREDDRRLQEQRRADMQRKSSEGRLNTKSESFSPSSSGSMHQPYFPPLIDRQLLPEHIRMGLTEGEWQKLHNPSKTDIAIRLIKRAGPVMLICALLFLYYLAPEFFNI